MEAFINITIFYFILGILCLYITFFAIKYNKKFTLTISFILAFISILSIDYFSLTTLLGNPKPILLEIINKKTKEARILWVSIVKDEAIYLLIKIPNKEIPIYIQRSWDEDLAKRLKKAAREAKKGKKGLMMKKPFVKSLENSERRFYPEPQTKLPDKKISNEGQLYQRTN